MSEKISFELTLANTSFALVCSVGSDTEYVPVHRQRSHYSPLDTFRLPSGSDRHYQQQYGDLYFIRLAKLKPAVEEAATENWDGFSVCLELTTRCNLIWSRMLTGATRLQESVRVAWIEYSTCGKANFAGLPGLCSWICR